MVALSTRGPARPVSPPVTRARITPSSQGPLPELIMSRRGPAYTAEAPSPPPFPSVRGTPGRPRGHSSASRSHRPNFAAAT